MQRLVALEICRAIVNDQGLVTLNPIFDRFSHEGFQGLIKG